MNLVLVALFALIIFCVMNVATRQTQDGTMLRAFLSAKRVHRAHHVDGVEASLRRRDGGQLHTESYASGLSAGDDRLSIDRQLAMADPHLPADFSWKTYLLYHPDLRSYGITTQQQSEDHYLRQGRNEGRLYKRMNLLLRYSVCSGFINQHYSHIAAFSLAAVLGAEIVLPVGCKRDSFGSTFNVDKTKNSMMWKSTPLDTILDVDKIIAYWAPKGLIVHKTPPVVYDQSLEQAESSMYPRYGQQDASSDTVVRMDDVYFMNYDMSELVEHARATVVNKAATLLKADPSRTLDRMTLDLPCTFFSLRTLSNLRLVSEVAGSLKFSPAIHAIAERVLTGIRKEHSEFNAVHLRVEKDAEEWIKILGGPERTWGLYLDAMRQGNFGPQTPMYVASGLLTYGSNQGDMQRIIGLLIHAGACSKVLYKEQFIDQPEISELTSEQKALLDFLVLAEGKAFVGLGASTFAYFLREHRALQRRPKSTTVLVDSSRIGTDPLFFSAATVI